MKLNKKGIFEWSKKTGGSGDEKNTIVREINRDNYIAGSWSESGSESEKTIALCNSDIDYYRDYWMFKFTYNNPESLQPFSSLATVNKLAAPKLSNRQFSVYPNPAKEVLHVQTEGKATVSLTDGTGRTLLTQTISGSGSINISRLQQGMYYLKNSATGETRKVMIVK